MYCKIQVINDIIIKYIGLIYEKHNWYSGGIVIQAQDNYLWQKLIFSFSQSSKQRNNCQLQCFVVTTQTRGNELLVKDDEDDDECDDEEPVFDHGCYREYRTEKIKQNAEYLHFINLHLIHK